MIRFHPLFLSAVTFFVAVAIGGAFINIAERRRSDEHRHVLKEIGAVQAHILERQLDRSLSSTFALASILRQSGRIDNFDTLAAEIIKSYGGISNLQLAPNGVVTQIYPLAGNEAAIGHDLLNDPRRRTEALAAIGSRRLTLAGPFTLIQGGVAVTGRLPVFVPDEAGGERFWGFTIALIRLPALLELSNLNRLVEHDYNYQLSRVDPDKGTRVVFAQSTEADLQNAIPFKIEVPNGRWTLALAPRGGWRYSSSLPAEIVLVVLVSMLVSALTYALLRQPEILRREVEARTRQLTEAIGFLGAESVQRERAEKALQEAHGRLEIRVQERTEELAQANVELKTENTERKRAEEALRKSEATARALLESAAEGIVIVNRDGRIVLANAKTEELFGYHRDELLGQTLEVLLPGRFQDEHASHRASYFTAPRVRPMGIGLDLAARRKDGTEFPVEISLTFVETEEGVLAMGFITDVTERKRAEEALRRSAERYRTLVETIPHGIEEIDSSGIITVANSAYHKQYEYGEGELIGTSILDLVATDSEREELRDYLKFLVKEQPAPTRYVGKKRTKNGRVIDVQVDWIYKRDTQGQVTGFTSIITDITERKRAEEALLESERQSSEQLAELELLYRTAPLGLCHMDSDLRYLRCNEKLAEINGISSADHIGRTLREIVPEIAATMESVYHQVIESGDPAIDVEATGATDADPQNVRHFSASYYPVKSEDGVVYGVSSIVQDITERKRAEEALKDAHNQLEGRVQERTKDLAKAIGALKTEITERKRAEEALRESDAVLRRNQKDIQDLAGKLLTAQEEERRRLARELHDDLTQRLAVLAIEAGKLEGQLESSGGGVPEKLRDMKEQMVKLAADVHTISRQLHPSILDDLGLVSAIESECTSFSEREGIRVKYESKNVPAVLPKDVALCIYRIIQESLRNIAKHAQTREAHVTLTGNDGGIHLSIKDTGIGFHPAQGRGKPGLGLASMEERVRLIQGDLSVQSRPGQGTVIEVRVPLTGGEV